MAKKGAYYARRFVLGKKFGTILLTGRKKGPGKLYYGKPRLVYPLTHACRMPTYIIRQLCRPTISLQAVQSVLTVLSLRAHRVCVLWNSSYRNNSATEHSTTKLITSFHSESTAHSKFCHFYNFLKTLNNLYQ